MRKRGHYAVQISALRAVKYALRFLNGCDNLKQRRHADLKLAATIAVKGDIAVLICVNLVNARCESVKIETAIQ